MGHSARISQALAAPPYLVAFFMVLLTSWLSDRYSDRSLCICFHSALATLGYAMIAIIGSQGKEGSVGWRYAGVYPAAVGFFSAITIIITWTINNNSSDSKKGTGVALLNFIGQLGPLIGTHLYPESDGPYYVKGMSICTAFMATVGILSLALRFILVANNRQNLTEYIPLDEEDEGHPARERKNRSSVFRYML